MQIQISSRDLLRSLDAVAKVISSKNSMPILGNVLVSQHAQPNTPAATVPAASAAGFSLTASDGENELTTDINLVVLEGQFFPFCVDPKHLTNTLATLGDQPLTLTVTAAGDNVKIDVRYLNGQFSVPGYVATEYPRIRTAETLISHFTASAPHLLTSMAAAVQCCAEDELRPQMGCVCLDVTSDDRNSPMPDRLVIVGSDGKRLYKNVIAHNTPNTPAAPSSQPDMAEPSLTFHKLDGKATLLVPRAVASKFSNAFKGTEQIEAKALGNITDSGSPVVHNIVFTAPGVTFITRAIDARYPNYNSVIPTQHLYEAVFNVKALQQSVKRISPFASDASQLIALRRKGFETILTSEDLDFSTSASESIDCQECNLPDNYAIGMKSTTLLQHLGIITTDNARFELSDPARPLIIHEDNPNSTLTLLLMPMIIQ